jgi:hypothetical protein
MKHKTKTPEAEMIAILDRWMNAENGAERLDLEKQLPKGITHFAYCLGYNNAAKCLADFRKHSQPAR